MPKGTDLMLRSLLIAWLCSDLIRYKSGFGYYGAWFCFVVWLIVAALEFHLYVVKKEA